ncbi:aldose epimerase [Acidobacterium sp. S8]|uniref:aldose epimerase n=1 Tax=Acidobacterium sp. S8 TaxID=1641854 RepID=UPI001C203CE7|nr:aldose epimerase [Acidobacterium sp. S8]
MTAAAAKSGSDKLRDSASSHPSIEQLILESHALRVTVLPSLGGKIGSIQILPENEELLQQPLRPYAPRTRYLNFDAGDASGWDECLPSVAGCEVQTASGKVVVPDHGDFWQVPWVVDSQSGSEVTLSAEGFSLPLSFRKTLRLDDNRLRVSYSVCNRGSDSVEYLWSAHPGFAVEKGDLIVLPSSVTDVIVEGSGQNRLGQQGTQHTWPQTTIPRQAIDLSIAGGAEDGIGDKLFTHSPAEGWCAIERKRLNRRVAFQFDPKQLPYLGLWLCYGGWPEHQSVRQHCVALEPCTAQGDSLATAMQEGRARRLSPQSEDNWTLELQVSGVS